MAKFSFLLSIPAILGATVFEAKNLVFSNVSLFALIVSMLISFIVGYISLKFLLRVIIKKKFHLFAYYCFFLGLIILII